MVFWDGEWMHFYNSLAFLAIAFCVLCFLPAPWWDWLLWGAWPGPCFIVIINAIMDEVADICLHASLFSSTLENLPYHHCCCPSQGLHPGRSHHWELLHGSVIIPYPWVLPWDRFSLCSPRWLSWNLLCCPGWPQLTETPLPLLGVKAWGHYAYVVLRLSQLTPRFTLTLFPLYFNQMSRSLGPPFFFLILTFTILT